MLLNFTKDLPFLAILLSLVLRYNYFRLLLEIVSLGIEVRRGRTVKASSYHVDNRLDIKFLSLVDRPMRGTKVHPNSSSFYIVALHL